MGNKNTKKEDTIINNQKIHTDILGKNVDNLENILATCKKIEMLCNIIIVIIISMLIYKLLKKLYNACNKGKGTQYKRQHINRMDMVWKLKIQDDEIKMEFFINKFILLFLWIFPLHYDYYDG